MNFDILTGLAATIAVLFTPIYIVALFKKLAARKVWWQAGGQRPNALALRYHRLSTVESVVSLLIILAFATTYVTAGLLSTGPSPHHLSTIVRFAPIVTFGCLLLSCFCSSIGERLYGR